MELTVDRFVTTVISDSSEKALGTLQLIRSYNHNPGDQSWAAKRQMTMPISRAKTKISDVAQKRLQKSPIWDSEVWKVARAATAAQWYFKPLKIVSWPRTEQLLFTYCGFYIHNPTMEGVQEVEDEYGSTSIGAVVSIGSARGDHESQKKGLLAITSSVKGFVQHSEDPERVHENVRIMAKAVNFPYFRLNDPLGLDIGLDEWEPRGRFTKATGSKTKSEIQKYFNEWQVQLHNRQLIHECAEELVKRRRRRI